MNLILPHQHLVFVLNATSQGLLHSAFLGGIAWFGLMSMLDFISLRQEWQIHLISCLPQLNGDGSLELCLRKKSVAKTRPRRK